MLRFTDPNSKKVSKGHTTYALLEAARRGHTKIMMVMSSPWDAFQFSGADSCRRRRGSSVSTWQWPLGHRASYCCLSHASISRFSYCTYVTTLRNHLCNKHFCFYSNFVSVKLLVASGASLTVTKFRRGRPKDTAVSLLISILSYILFLN